MHLNVNQMPCIAPEHLHTMGINLQNNIFMYICPFPKGGGEQVDNVYTCMTRGFQKIP